MGGAIRIFGLICLWRATSAGVLPACGDDVTPFAMDPKEPDCYHNFTRYTFLRNPRGYDDEWRYRKEDACAVCIPLCSTSPPRYLDTAAYRRNCDEYLKIFGFLGNRKVWVRETAEAITYLAPQARKGGATKISLPVPKEEKCKFVMQEDDLIEKTCLVSR
ncbi:hypothetical protein EVAR_38133_1 [Eumeta japonica]|uniref:Uncharacterized protein n=1 Tax=Eumeta variegata TaxID=151549 RepID=A0A4C1YSK7_EUMVA|nr:hypothetical protein EVAR_38133_1 [Eumeta japonica]